MVMVLRESDYAVNDDDELSTSGDDSESVCRVDDDDDDDDDDDEDEYDLSSESLDIGIGIEGDISPGARKYISYHLYMYALLTIYSYVVLTSIFYLLYFCTYPMCKHRWYPS